VCRVESKLISSKGNRAVVPGVVPIADVVKTSIFRFAAGNGCVAEDILERVEGCDTAFSWYYGWSG
jgi:hypothetical protein